MNRIKVSTIVLLLLAGLLPASSAYGKLLFGPYLQSVSPESCLVCAFVEEGDDVCVGLFRENENTEEIRATGATPTCAVLSSLSPDVVYRYELLLDGVRVGATEPIAFVPNPQKEMTVVVFGDTRSGDNSFDLSHRHIMEALRLTVVPDMIFHTGDFTERGDDVDLWTNFFHIEREVLAGTPIFPSIGRSDQPPALMRKIFPLLKKAPWYSVDRGEVHVAVLKLWQARLQTEAETAPTGDQARWLQQDLAAARDRGARYVFVVMHEPAFDISGRSSKAAKKVFVPLFEAYRVTAVFSGAHYFSHVVKNGVHYFTNGGGGAVLDLREPKEGAFRFFSAIHHFIQMDIGSFGVRLRAVDAQGEDFYEANLGEEPVGIDRATAPTFVKSFAGGARSVSLDVFFEPGCEDCAEFAERLPAIAERLGITLVVTFRSLVDAENEALLNSLGAETGPTPIVSVGARVLVGSKQVETDLDAAVIEAIEGGGGRVFDVRWLLIVGAIVAGVAFLLFAFKLRSR